MDSKPDAALVGEALAGRGEAFSDLVHRYQDYAYGLAVARLSDFELARDVVQESFLCAYRDLAKLRDHARFAGWLRGIVRHTANRALRELQRVRSLAEELGRAAELGVRASRPSESAEETERREIVRRALERLNEKNREVVSLFYVDGLSYADIAGFLGVSETTVQGRLQRGRAALKKELLTMVEQTFKSQELPDDFAAEVQSLLDAAAKGGRAHEEAIRRMAGIGAPAVDSLCQALGDPRIPVRRAAACALCKIGDVRALRPILRLLYSNDYWTFNVLFRGGRILAIPGVRDELLRIVREGQRDEQYWAIQALGHARGDEEVYARLLQVFRSISDQPMTIRCSALAALCDLKPETAFAFVCEASNDLRFRRCSGWAWWIAHRNGLRLPLEVCRSGFGRDIAPVSRWMAGDLALRHGEEGRKALEQLMRTGSPDESASAALSLARPDFPEAFEVLKTELVTGYRERKWTRMVARTLAKHYGAQLSAWAQAEPARLAEVPGLAWALSQARLLQGDQTTEYLLRYGTPSARAALVRRLAQERGAAFLPELRRFLAEGQPRKVSQEAFWQMFGLRDAAMPVAQEMLASEAWPERKAALCLLRRWGKLSPRQQAQARKDAHPAVRHAADWHPVYVKAAGWHPKWSRRLGDKR